MKLVNNRLYFTKNSTIGKLSVDDKDVNIFILEPQDAGLYETNMTLQQILDVKASRLTNKKYTAIAPGIRKLAMVPVVQSFLNHYPYFLKTGVKELPELQGIVGFSSILIHIGNFETPKQDDTEGCQVVGNTMATDTVYGSGQAFEWLKANVFPEIAKGTVTYETRRDPVAWAKYFPTISN